MAGALAPTLTAPAARILVRALGPDDVEALRLPGTRSAESLRRALEVHPGRSVWAPSTLEYALIGSWRNRPEIASVDELVAVTHVEPLLRAAFERCVDNGDELLLAIELELQRSPSRFERAGLELLEEVITYEIEVPRKPWAAGKDIRPVRVDPNDERAVELVTEMDQAAFPWLWRNSRAEFDVYLRTPGVEVSLIESHDEPVAYIGATIFPAWGHLDRIAVAPDRQGRGFGREAVGLAVDAVRRQGARRLALSTQRTNWRSRRLYERFGFRRTLGHDYRLFGAWRHPDRRAVGRTASGESRFQVHGRAHERIPPIAWAAASGKSSD